MKRKLREEEEAMGYWFIYNPNQWRVHGKEKLNGQDGIILGVDTKATEGPIVAYKNCEKIHYMAYCYGAGTAADTKAVTVAVTPSGNCFYQGHVSAALVFGGVGITGPHLHTSTVVMVASLFGLGGMVVGGGGRSGSGSMVLVVKVVGSGVGGVVELRHGEEYKSKFSGTHTHSKEKSGMATHNVYFVYCSLHFT
ncbi:hypothetical protein IFM89_025414 [Coptis chinensis]|uniref:Uncharacterized protein n=1 Tax=Coptis chinensis TaxID=261450 RepID=A0A835H0W1_9MAGN|nr:hypothetical protein IFM89_025414 [Coptis chinensis]